MSIPRSRNGCLWLLLVLLPLVGQAAMDPEVPERERIARERVAVEQESRAAQAACASQFAVTACTDKAKADRRRRLQVLDRQRAVLDDEQRKRRAAARVELIRQRQASATDVRPEVAVKARSSPASAAARTDAASAARARSVEDTLAARQAAASRAEAEASQRVLAAQKRAAQAEAHSSAVEKRNRERAKLHPPGVPLAVPPAPSQPN